MPKFKDWKSIPKRVLEKQVKQGVWLEVRWLDAPNSLVLVGDSDINWREKGDVTIDCWSVDTKGKFHRRGTWISHDQIVRVGPVVEIPWTWLSSNKVSAA